MNVALLTITSLLAISSSAMEHNYSNTTKSEELRQLKPVSYNQGLVRTLTAHQVLIARDLPFIVSNYKYHPIISENSGRKLLISQPTLLNEQWLFDEIPKFACKPVIIRDQCDDLYFSIFTNENLLFDSSKCDLIATSNNHKINALAVYSCDSQKALVAMYTSDIISPFLHPILKKNHNFLKLYSIHREGSQWKQMEDSYQSVPISDIQKLAFRNDKELVGLSKGGIVRIHFNDQGLPTVVKEEIFRANDERSIIAFALNCKVPNRILFMDQKYAVYLGLLPEGLKNNNRRFKKIASPKRMTGEGMDILLRSYMSWQDNQVTVGHTFISFEKDFLDSCKHSKRRKQCNEGSGALYLNPMSADLSSDKEYKLAELSFNLDYAKELKGL